MTLVLEALGSDESLDLGSLGVGSLALALGLDLASDDVLADLYGGRRTLINISCVSVSIGVVRSDSAPASLERNSERNCSFSSSHASNDRAGDDECCTYIVILAETEEAANLGGTLGAKTLGVDDVGEAGNLVLALLDDGKGKDGKIHGDDAATDRLPLALAGAAGAVAGVAIREQEPDTSRVHDTLLHGETLLVVSAGDAEDVALELIAKVVAGNLLSHLKQANTC